MNSIISQCDHTRLYRFVSTHLLSTFAASPELYDQALIDNNRANDGPIEIQKYLREGNYPDWIHFPVIFHQIDGHRLLDVIESRRTFFDLISERVISLMEKECFTGWKSYPVIVLDRKKEIVSGYCGLSVTGRGGRIQYLKDGREINYNYRKEDQVYDVSKWDGSDFFLVSGGGIFVTERVMTTLKKNRITGVKFLPIEDNYTIRGSVTNY